MEQQQFTKYEIARILGARALQIAMDAPLLVKITEEKLKEMKYSALEIAEYEFKEGVLPITINRPSPRKRKEKLGPVKEEKMSDEEIAEKAKEVEKEIVEDAKESGFVNEGEDDESFAEDSSTESEER